VLSPLFDDDFGLLESVKDFAVEQLIPKAGVEALAVPVLLGRPWGDIGCLGSDTRSRSRTSSIHRRRRAGLNSSPVQLPEEFAYPTLSPRPRGGDVSSPSPTPSNGETGHAPSRHVACAIGNTSAALRQSDGLLPLLTGIVPEAPLLDAISPRSLLVCLACLQSSDPPLMG
jgi:hypothetical protein